MENLVRLSFRGNRAPPPPPFCSGMTEGGGGEERGRKGIFTSVIPNAIKMQRPWWRKTRGKEGEEAPKHFLKRRIILARGFPARNLESARHFPGRGMKKKIRGNKKKPFHILGWWLSPSCVADTKKKMYKNPSQREKKSSVSPSWK